MATRTDDLLHFLFDGQPHLLAQPVATWLASSRRFSAFADLFRDKIRKKIRTTRDQSGLLDLQAELETAYLLLQERSLSLVYEPEQSKGIRSPDFAVTFTTSLTFMVEVTRMQADLKNAADGTSEPTSALAAQNTLAMRLAEATLEKLGQLLPRRANILVVATDAAQWGPLDIPKAMLGMQQRAEREDAAVLQRQRFLDRADFFRHYQRLSEVLVRMPHPESSESLAAWINPQARYPLPSRVRTVLYRALAG